MKYYLLSFKLILLSYIFCPLIVEAQVATHITNFNHKAYIGGVQNWGTAISPEQVLYVGNNNGLLRYNGNDWSLFEPGERATIRAVHVVENRIYTAGDNNIGYWEQNSNGKITYTSLLPQVNQMGITGDTFWSIGSLGKNIYFQAFGNIVIYDGQKMDYLVKQDFYSLLFQTDGKLFTQKFGNSLQQISGNKLIPFCNDPLFIKEEVKFIYQLTANRYLVGFSNGELYTLENNVLKLFYKLVNENSIPVRIDCGKIWKDEMLAVGTIGDGLYLIRLNDLKQTHINSPQLQDLNIHSLCFVDENFLWLSLDNGISSVILDPKMYLWKSYTEIGTFFDAAYFNGRTYIASNQGMYSYEEGGRKIQTSIFPLQFCNLKNELLCGTTSTLYKMTAQQPSFQKFCDVNGVEQFEYIADKGNEYIFLRAYSGISLLHYKDNTWKYLSMLVGTVNYRYIMPENLYTVWALHPEKGIFRLRINDKLDQIIGSDNFTEIDEFSNYSNINIIKIEGRVLFATPKGIYLFDVTEKKFKRQENLSNQIMYLDKLQSIRPAYGNNVWVAANNELFLYHITDLSAELVMNLPFVHNEFTLYDKHLNLRSVNDSIAFVSTCEGTVIIDNGKISRNKSQKHSLRVETFYYTNKNNGITYLDFHQPNIDLPNTATNITIKVTTGLLEYPASISYRLPGVSEEWSEWQTSGIIHFTNLPSGTYKLEIRDSDRNAMTISLLVAPPIYKRTWMILIYILVLVIITIILATVFSERKRKILQRKYTEELKKQEFEQLQEKVVSQENELKNRMRFLSHKQELLDTISSEIETQKKELGDRYPNKLYLRLMNIIQEGKTEKDKFLSFENYFVEVHHDFMLRMKKTHPSLSASELKFCCLLRANLSTKEISVIMGIAIRSVELRKHRLKQRLGLGSEDSLTSYILSI